MVIHGRAALGIIRPWEHEQAPLLACRDKTIQDTTAIGSKRSAQPEPEAAVTTGVYKVGKCHSYDPIC